MGLIGSASVRVRSERGLRRAALLLGGLFVLALAFAPRADAFIYWADDADGTIGRANNDGTGIDRSFIDDVPEPCGVAVSGTHIYWANQLGASIGRARLDGTEVQQRFITGASLPCGPALDNTHVYWTNGATSDANPGSIGRARLDGADVQSPLFPPNDTFVEQPFGAAVGNGFLYWANQAPPRIGRSPIPDLLPVGSYVANAGVFGAFWPSVTASHLYWAVFNLGIARVPLADPTTPLTQVTEASASGGTAIHGAKLYWANGQEGTVSRANLDGGSPEVAFVTGVGSPRGIAIDSGSTPPGTPQCGEVELGKAKKNKRKGSAKLAVEVGCAGTLELGGKGVKPAEKEAGAAGEVKLPVKAKGKKKKKLKDKGKAKLKAEVTFTPNGGAPTTEDKNVKLVKK